MLKHTRCEPNLVSADTLTASVTVVLQVPDFEPLLFTLAFKKPLGDRYFDTSIFFETKEYENKYRSGSWYPFLGATVKHAVRNFNT